ncbi:MAG: hypothetical protein JNJ59_14780 [Deltaproteobacteria bacterium]|jgi:hypothetical protein|nr:hypothetical protein [Deltaproteobacteria bacterium]
MAALTSRSRSLTLGLVLAVLPLTLTTQGCNRYGWEIFRGAVEVAAYVAVTAMVLAAHDAHYHSYHCGHHYVVVENRPVYEYQGRWEYYDPHEDTWYYYPEGPPDY